MLSSLACSQVTTVTTGTNTVTRFTSEHRTHFNFFNVSVLNSCGFFLVDLFTGTHEEFIRIKRIDHILARMTAHETVGQVHDLFFAFVYGLQPNTIVCSTISFPNDNVLSNIHELPCHVTRIRCLEGGISQSFTCTMRRDEVLQHSKTLAEVRENRFLNDIATWLGHQATHTSELTNLLAVTTCTGIHHECDGVVLVLTLIGLERLQHHVGDFVRGMRPDIDDLVVTFAWGNHTLAVLFLYIINFLLGRLDLLALLGRNDHVINTDRSTGLGGFLEAQLLELVQRHHGLLLTRKLIGVAN